MKPIHDKPDGPRLYTAKEACAKLAISRTTLYELVKANRLRIVKVGTRQFRVPSSEIERFMAEGS